MTKKKYISDIRNVKSLARIQGKRLPKPLVLIVCEGITEKLYFEGMRKDFGSSTIEVRIHNAKGSAPINVVNYAEKIGQKSVEPYDYIYCVFDRDSHETFQQACEKIVSLSTRKRNPLKIKEAISIICFEIWILLHFKKIDKQFANSDEVIKFIEKNNYINKYDKSDLDLFNKVKNKVKDAVENAKWLEGCATDNNRNPYTNIHYLVLFLQNLSDSKQL